jgi:hypothetical protein
MYRLFTPWSRDNANHFSSGTTHAPPHSSITGGQESPGFSPPCRLA